MNVLALKTRVRFTLKSKTFDSIIIDKPIGWETDDKEFTRNENYHGIFLNLSNNLTFIGNAYDYIKLVKNTEGVLAELRLVKDERHPITDEWVQTYSGYLDMITYEEDEDEQKIKLKFNSGGIESVIKSRETELIEIDRVDTIDGELLLPLVPVNLKLPGRNIFLESVWEIAAMSYDEEIYVNSQDGNRRNTSTTVPLELLKKSHEQANSTFLASAGSINNGVNTMMLLNNIDRSRSFKVKLTDISFNCSTTKNQTNWAYVAISLIKTNNGTNYNIIDRKTIWKAEGDSVNPPRFGGNYGGTQILNGEFDITLNQNESLGIELLLEADLKNGRGDERYANFYFRFLDGNISIQEESYFDASTINAIKPFDLIDRLITINTNQRNIIKSDILQYGKWKDLLIAHGFWIRGFSREKDFLLNDEDKKFKPLTTSIKDFLNSFDTIGNIGLGIEKIGYKEKIIIEELTYFYNQNVTIKLPKPVKNLKRTIESNKLYKNVEIGFEKGGEYEEAMGLDEYNVKNTYTTVLNNIGTPYSKVSKYRADSYGSEFARRKPFEIYPTEDTSYDQDPFFFDSKNIGINEYTVRLWRDDFNNVPKGIYSPESAFNLRLSPFNSLLRHGWCINAGLTLYPNGKIKYGSSTGNSSLITDYAENGEIFNNKLQRARYLVDIVEFEHEVDFNISQALLGTSNFNGKEIPNVYGLIEFEHNGKTESGYLLSVKPNGEGKFKLIKSYR